MPPSSPQFDAISELPRTQAPSNVDLYLAALAIEREEAPVVIEFSAADGRDGRCLARCRIVSGRVLIVCSEQPELDSLVSIADAAPAPYEAAADEFEIPDGLEAIWIEHLPPGRARRTHQFHKITLRNGMPCWQPLGTGADDAAAA